MNGVSDLRLRGCGFFPIVLPLSMGLKATAAFAVELETPPILSILNCLPTFPSKTFYSGALKGKVLPSQQHTYVDFFLEMQASRY